MGRLIFPGNACAHLASAMQTPGTAKSHRALLKHVYQSASDILSTASPLAGRRACLPFPPFPPPCLPACSPPPSCRRTQFAHRIKECRTPQLTCFLSFSPRSLNFGTRLPPVPHATGSMANSRKLSCRFERKMSQS